jgi:hypothetical protein
MTNPARSTNPSMVPLRREPRRIRPPFDVDSYQPDHSPISETDGKWRDRRYSDRVTALLEALDGVELGEYDRRIIEWLANWDTSVVGTVASLFYRARATGVSDGAQ